MKLFIKAVILIFLLAVILIVLYPSKITYKLNGNWVVQQIIKDGKQYDFQHTITIDGNRFDVDLSGFGKLLDNNPINYTYTIINNDSIVIVSKYPAFFNGRYKINKHIDVIGGGGNAYRDITLSLKSKNKLIILSRSENIVWQKGIPRGKP
ncbi:hypothetical protein [Flavobacterium subsaxonicum]|uniref:Uncharacterized protein n=1 Tax=Flavobacterium subsaxonicum WB 4.1-42 = DSM 21790 TaxID=1121898 RepID=A0A0A2MJD5_9FLAO|nr:hypothetical protein [Flavobacterium subsaxonicum]KGO92727.1 hypothetical protein Q766_11465 [Flavobacterium subsaxonicum WB 4.1-42 = DSM 21790]